MPGSLSWGSLMVRGGAERISASQVQAAANTGTPGPRCSMHRIPPRAASRGSISPGRCPSSGMPTRPASASAARNVSRVVMPALMKSAPCSCCARTSAAASAGVAELSGVSSAPGVASSAGAPGGAGSRPARRSLSSLGLPDIWRNPVTPLASISAYEAATWPRSLSAWA